MSPRTHLVIAGQVVAITGAARGIGKAFVARDVDTAVVRAVLQQAIAA